MFTMTRYLPVYGAILIRSPLKAVAIAWWWFTRRRVRAVNQLREGAKDLKDTYRYWRALNEPALKGSATPRLALAIHLHLPSGQDMHLGRKAMLSVLDQSFPFWTLYITSADGIDGVSLERGDNRIEIIAPALSSHSDAIRAVLEITDASHLIPLPWSSTLNPDALLAYALARDSSQSNALALLYADQDERDANGERSNPWFKPKWDADLFLAQDYLSAACAIPVASARQKSTNLQSPDSVAVLELLTRLLLPRPDSQEAPVTAYHVNSIAITTPPNSWRQNNPARTELMRTITAANLGARMTEGPFGTLRIHRQLIDPAPRVTVVVPTRDRVDLLEVCIEGVLKGTDYPELEVVIADNGSIEPDTLAYFAAVISDPRVHIVHWPHDYNYSAINNFAVEHASGPYICLLNNDIEVIDRAWLREMMAHAIRPEVGAVGAKLIYPDHSIQHAGVVVGMGGAAGHAHRGLIEGDPGYFAQTLVAREATAVTAACLVIAKDKFDAVDGLDDQGLAIAYNDVDLCLKLRAAGWRNIYAAQATLIHHESKSRGLDLAPENLARYKSELTILQERWMTVGFEDPTHHPALDPASETYRLRL